MVAEVPVLRPWRVLARFRPVTVRAAARRLREFYRLGQALGLVRRHQPALLSDELAGLPWYQVLALFLEAVERANWFEIDVEVVDEAWQVWQYDPDDEGDRLARYLVYIPLRLYGLGDVSDEPVLELLRWLFSSRLSRLSHEVVVQADLHEFVEGWDRAARERAWGWLVRIEEDPGRYPEPARWLPELVRWACGRTGNYILDTCPGRGLNPPVFNWDSVDEVRVAWRRARPVLEQYERLVTWLEQDEARLALLARCLIDGINYDHLDW